MVKRVATQGAGDGQVIDLALGHPSGDLLPLELVRSAARARLAAADASLLQYGLEQGDPGLRALLADLSGSRAERLFVTAGASQALDLLCTLTTRHGDTVLTTDPTYHLALRTFADHGLEVVGVESDDDGPDPQAVEHAATNLRPRFLYLVTPFANPSGASTSRERLTELSNLAQRHGFWLVTDEVYRLLHFTGATPARAEGESWISLHSFSKILAPGLRLGWIEAPERFVRRIEESGLLLSGGGLNPFVGAIVEELLEGDGFAGHLDRLRRELAERAHALVAAIEEYLPGAQFHRPEGGYFVWLRLPGVDSTELLPAANAAGVNYQPGERFSSGSNCRDRLRLSFSHYPPEQLHSAVRRLAGAVQSTTPIVGRRD